MPWRYKICIAKCLYSDGDNLLNNLIKITAKDCKTSTFGWRASLKNWSLFKLPIIIPNQEITIVLLWLLPAHVTSSFSKISDFIWKEKEHFWKAGFVASSENNDLFLNKTGKCGLGPKKRSKLPSRKTMLFQAKTKQIALQNNRVFVSKTFNKYYLNNKYKY